MTIKQPSRYVKLLVRKAPEAKRVLLGELVVVEDQPVLESPNSVRQPPTPMHVKIALDRALLNAGVKFLYGSAITDVLHDKDGQPAGIVMANRAGRQAVKAKVVIDATARATAARVAGARFKAFPSGTHKFQRVVVGGQPHEGEGVDVRKADVKFFSKDGERTTCLFTR